MLPDKLNDAGRDARAPSKFVKSQAKSLHQG